MKEFNFKEFVYSKKLLTENIEDQAVYSIVKKFGRNPSVEDLVSYCRNNWSKLTGLKKSSIDQESHFPEIIENIADHFGYSVFDDEWIHTWGEYGDIQSESMEDDDSLEDSTYQELVDDIVEKSNGDDQQEYDFTIEALKLHKIYNEDQIRGFYKFAKGTNFHHIAEALRDVLRGKVNLEEDLNNGPVDNTKLESIMKHLKEGLKKASNIKKNLAR